MKLFVYKFYWDNGATYGSRYAYIISATEPTEQEIRNKIMDDSRLLCHYGNEFSVTRVVLTQTIPINDDTRLCIVGSDTTDWRTI